MGGKSPRLLYIGRPAAASPATGLLRRHVKEQAALVDAALTLRKLGSQRPPWQPRSSSPPSVNP